MTKLNLREHLLKYGPHTLSDEELLAIILRTGSKQKNVLSLAREILSKYSGKKLFELTANELKSIPGLGDTKVASIIAAMELVHRNFISQPKILTPEDAIKCAYELVERKKENFVVLFLNTKKMLLGKEYVSIGNVDTSIVDPREVFVLALKHNSCGIILLHNHPSSDTSPSSQDKEITQRIVSAGEVLNIEVVDHIIVSRAGYFSFKEHHLI